MNYPPSFSWNVENPSNTTVYLNVSTSPTIEEIDVINSVDNGTHQRCPSNDDIGRFQRLRGKRLYWRLSADACGSRINSPINHFVVGNESVDPNLCEER